MNDAYAAGLMDGEGTVTLTKYKKSDFRYPTVSVSSTTQELVKFMKSNYGGCISVKERPDNPSWKQGYQWTVIRNEAISFLNKVLPYMKEPEKIRRGNLVVNEYLTVTPRNGYYTESIEKAKFDFQMRFFSNSTQGMK